MLISMKSFASQHQHLSVDPAKVRVTQGRAGQSKSLVIVIMKRTRQKTTPRINNKKDNKILDSTFVFKQQQKKRQKNCTSSINKKCGK